MKKHFVLLLALFAVCTAGAQTSPPPAEPVPPPAAPAQRTPADLEKLLAPIALYPDPLIATILPASVYPIEIVTAARFVKDTNNIPQIDDQPWDDNVKAVAHVPEVIEMMNTNLTWTVDLGQAFLDQQKDVMDAIQSLRLKAQNLGTLASTPQQVVVVTNTVVEKTVEQQIVYVTNTIVQIVPSNPQVIYVPIYNPYYVYYPRPPYYIGPPPIVTFAAGVTVGLILANNCNWRYGGIYVGPRGVAVWGGGGYHGHGNVNINVNRNVNINTGNINTGNRPSTTSAGQQWQPDQSRLSKSGAPGSAATTQARGWNSGSPAAARPTTTTAARPATTATGSTMPSTANRPATSTPANASRPAPSTTSTANRAGPSTPAARPTTTAPTSRPTAGSSSANRSAPSSASQPSAFGGVSSGNSASSFSSRGSSSRGGTGGGGGGSSATANSGGRR